MVSSLLSSLVVSLSVVSIVELWGISGSVVSSSVSCIVVVVVVVFVVSFCLLSSSSSCSVSLTFDLLDESIKISISMLY